MKQLFALLAFMPHLLPAYIIQGQAWEKTLEHDRTQYIVCLGDLHMNRHELADIAVRNPQSIDAMRHQRNNFLKAVQTYEKSLCIIEDPEFLTNREATEAKLQKLLDSPRSTDFLMLLPFLCNQRKIDMYLPEFRTNLNEDPLDTPLTDFFAIHFDPIVKEVAAYKDTPGLEEYYHAVLDRINTHEAPLLNHYRQHPVEGATLQDIDMSLDPLDRSIEDFEIDSSKELFDARIIHKIHECSQEEEYKKYIFVCVGNNHVDAISRILPQMGYKKVIQMGHQENDSLIDRHINREMPETLDGAPSKYRPNEWVDITQFFTRFNQVTENISHAADATY